MPGIITLDRRGDHRDVIDRLVRQRPVIIHVRIEAARPGIIRREKARRAINLVHFMDIGRSRHDIVVGVERVRAQPVPRRHLTVSARLQLHQPHGASRRYRELARMILLAA